MTEMNVDGASGSPNTESGSLFEGKQFWLSKQIPQRERFKDIIKEHGGIIRLYEKDAEIKLVDHARKNLPADTFSYRYVENSVRKKRLENLDDYKAGPSATRPVGATNIPRRGHKIPFSLEDDQILWDWMQPHENNKSAPISGNRFYQELAEKNPRHTYQSYRDRYLRRLRGRPRPGGMPQPISSTSAAQENSQGGTVPPATSTSPRQMATQDTGTPVQMTDDRKRKRTPVSETSETTSGVDSPNPKKRAAVSFVENTRQAEPRRGEGSPNLRVSSPEVITPTFSESHAMENLNEDNTKEVEETPRSQGPVEELKPIDPLFLELPFLPSSSETPETLDSPGRTEGSEQDIDVWIDRRLQPGKVEEELVIEALRCTSMDPHLADKVLKYLVSGKSIPDDMAGVWTAEDDRCIEGKDTRGIERVLSKHGSEYFNARWEYLGMARSAGLEKGQEETTDL
ncbi:putative transcription factor Rap1 [Aspergillus tanneri]|uniref:DNA-binding protein RAP1 n=1 Tax=Aspergillus tanneri TaxID=1220188 RepID=A0A5M9MNT3_9EURO|nr:uncharacterized protein ATNIH1004_008518 [Aspergillus tanneri]KAA8644317.1 hypothetical protein ATNIH1004_008518 [Aspergillus tanneri]